MAFGVAEDPVRSPISAIEGVEYPAWREAIVELAADSGAPPDVINLLKSLPKKHYYSREEVLRDLAEAARRFAMGGTDVQEDNADRDRSNIGRDMVENAPKSKSKHP
jgi:hypothetical protein